MKARILAGMTLVVAALVVACGGDDDDAPEPGGVLFDPARAPELAVLALPDIPDLPGTGWEGCTVITRCPEVGGEQFRQVIAELPSCAALPPPVLSVINGGDLDWAPSGYASVDFSRHSTSGAPAPQSLSVEVRISPTAEEVTERWDLTRQFFESEDGRNCYADSLNQVFEAFAEGSESPQQVTVVGASASAPHEGIAFGLATLATLADDEMSPMKIEMYRWPYSNAAITVVVAGDPNDLNREFVSRLLRAVDRRVIEAGQPGAADEPANQLAATGR